MANINDILLEESVSHQLDLVSYSNGALRRMMGVLNRADDDLFERIRKALERLPADSFTIQRLESILKSVRDLNAEIYSKLNDELEGELASLVKSEGSFQYDLFKATLPVQISIARIVPDQVFAAAMARPFEGRILKEWAASIEANRMARIRDEIRIGYVANETIDQIIQRIRGTRSLGYADGILEIDRRQAEAVVRTAINHTAFVARNEFYNRNASLIKGLRWTATLDSRTSPICRALDGRIFPLNKGQRPPAHWNCRSTMVPVIKNWRELGIDADELPASTRASMNGQVPSDLTYQQWLEKQSAERQDVILGPARGRLFRNGMPVTKFVNRSGHELTLAELAKTRLGKSTIKASDLVDDVKPVRAPELPEVVPSKTLRDAEIMGMKLIAPNQFSYTADPRDGLPAVRYRHFKSGDNRQQALDKLFNTVSYARMKREVADEVNRVLRDVQEEMDRLGLPRIRAVTTNAGKALATMGDGVLSVSPKLANYTDNALQRTWKRGDSQAYVRGSVISIPFTAEGYLATKADAIRNTIWHETAHHIHNTYAVTDIASFRRPPLETYLADLWNALGPVNRIHPTQYSKTNSKEWFAESYALHKMGRSDLIDENLLDILQRLERGEGIL
ncbi:phage head morphogenesis protein [Methylovorus glucosotrophus]|uniref:Phage head morphogenesis protein, SPP1 gp7 family n=1 Tax=Methylovorus glucosotrophus (strain SIP3-4) TaxID=582744 RepID=C6XEA0_METGS|nr:minor capsid protein [Methylovorus glucosotrophus]ACT50875.1 phage head morphogenesis protein, SPP1 gp7 family [Methylovorus glucosotrophus SIP3-4]